MEKKREGDELLTPHPPPSYLLMIFFSFLNPDNSSWNNFNFPYIFIFRSLNFFVFRLHYISSPFFLFSFCLFFLFFLYSRVYIVLLNKKKLKLIGPCLQLLNKEKEKCRRKNSISGQQRSHLKFETTQYL